MRVFPNSENYKNLKNLFLGAIVTIGVVIRGHQARRVDLATGIDRGSVGESNARSAACDGTYIVIVYANGTAKRYEAVTGIYRGSVGEQNAVECGVSGGMIVLTYKDGRARRYDARTGIFRGSL